MVSRIGQADFVVSTVLLKECRIEHITGSPLLKDEDYIRIGNRNRETYPGLNLFKKREKISIILFFAQKLERSLTVFKVTGMLE